MESPAIPVPHPLDLVSETSSLEDLVIEKQKLRTRSPRIRRDKSDLHNSASPKRSKTFWTSFRYLQGLSQKQVDDFMNSYVIYGLDWSDENR
jgi:sterol 24-C-methyltransferase